jgi:hypothetical protein
METKTVLVLGGAWTSLQCYKLSKNISAVFRGVFGIFCSVSKLLFIYFTTNCGTPYSVLQNPAWKTVV